MLTRRELGLSGVMSADGERESGEGPVAPALPLGFFRGKI